MKKAKTQLKNTLTDGDLQAIGDIVGGLMDKQAAVLASKKDLVELESRMASKKDLEVLEKRLNERMDTMEIDLKDYIHQGTEAVMHGMDNLSERFVEKQEFEKLVARTRIVEQKVGIRPKI